MNSPDLHQPLFLLHLEDSPRDRELVRAHLEAQGFEFKVVYADNRPEFERALEHHRFDLILADFTVPSYDGMTALKRVLALCPETPFIFVSGTIGEERAVESLKCGATDYVPKGHLHRLGSAIRRALRESREHLERQRAEEALRLSEQRLKLAVRVSNIGLWEWEIETNRVYFSPEWKAQLGFADHELPNAFSEWESRLHPEDRDRTLATLKAFIVDPGKRHEAEFRLRHKHGDYRWIYSQARLFPTPTGQLRMIACHKDITTSKQDELALRESEHKYRHLFESLSDSALLVDAGDGQILDGNSQAERLLGMPRAEFIGQPFARYFQAQTVPKSPDQRVSDPVREPVEKIESEILRKDGRRVPVEFSARPVTLHRRHLILALLADITERKRLEEQFIQAQKMEVVGQLAGGVAHDFNNILAVIMGYADLMVLELGAGDPSRPFAEEIRGAAERAAALTRQLLVFSRKQTMQPIVLDPNEIVAGMKQMLRRLVDESIDLAVSPGKKIGRVKADSGYLGQILLNLVINARDAMPKGGRLTIETANATLDEQYARSNAGVTPGEYVVFEVRDTGTGMTEEVKARIFEPFFTTKPKGHGTGLGLSTCYTIVKQCGGHIGVNTELGKGTTFKVYLPRVDQPLDHDTTFIKAGPLPRGSETVLLVEDEPSLRHLAAKVLKAQGYQVLCANSGQDGLQVARAHKGQPLRLVVTDVIMPQMNGKVMAEWLKATYPDIRVLFTSGYTDAAIAHHGVLDPGVEFLAKPYTPAALARKVRDVLDAAK